MPHVHPAESELRDREAQRGARGAAPAHQLVHLRQEPRVVAVPRPALSPEQEHELAHVRQLLHDSPARFDGAIWLVHQVDAPAIEVFPASYAWLFCPSITLHLGPLCICIDVTDRQGRRLIQWADPDLVHHPEPRLAVGGYVDADEHPREAALREAEEELGLGIRELADLTAKRLVIAPSGVMVIYAATGSESMPLRLGNEVLDVAWITAGSEAQYLPDEQLAYLG